MHISIDTIGGTLVKKILLRYKEQLVAWALLFINVF